MEEALASRAFSHSQRPLPALFILAFYVSDRLFCDIHRNSEPDLDHPDSPHIPTVVFGV